MAGDSSESIEVLAVGDVFFNRTYPRTAVEPVKERFDRADVRIGNLESPVSDTGEVGSFAGSDSLRADPNAMDGVTYAGFDLLGLANNHTMDYGPAAMVDTIERLEENGIAYAGGGRNREEAEAPGIVEAGGISVGMVAFEATTLSLWITDRVQDDRAGMNIVDVNPQYPDPNVDLPDVEVLRRVVRDAADEVDVLFAMLHFGASGYTRTPAQYFLAREAIDAGADGVIGGQPHVVQGVDVYEGAPILYSLGHFFWDSFADEYPHVGKNSFPRDTVLASLETSSTGVTEFRLYPVVITEAEEQPRFVEPGSTAFDRIADRVIELSEKEGTTPEREDDRLVVRL